MKILKSRHKMLHLRREFLGFLREFFGINSQNFVNFLRDFLKETENSRNFAIFKKAKITKKMSFQTLQKQGEESANSRNFKSREFFKKFTKNSQNSVNFLQILKINSQKSVNFLAIFAFLPLIFSACAVVQKATPNPTAHIIKADESIVAHPKKSSKILKINPIQSLFYLKGTQISYIKDNELGAYTKHLWGESPVNLTRNLLAQKVEKNGIFKAVLAQSSQIDANIVLESSLDAFEQVFDDDVKSVNLSENGDKNTEKKDALNDESVVKVELNARLIDYKSKKLLAAKTFTQSVKVGKSSPQNAIRAFDDALNKLGNDVVKWLANFS